MPGLYFGVGRAHCFGFARWLIAAGLAIAACNRPPETPPPPSRSGQVAVANRIRLFYEIHGQGDTLVLIHGGFTDRRVWNQQLDELSRDFTVIRYDLRGFGRSDFPSRPYRPSGDLLALYDELSIGQAALIGLSSGGEVALSFTLAHPDRVTALLLASSPAVGLPVSPEDSALDLTISRAVSSGGVDSGVVTWLRHPGLASLREKPELANQMEFLVRENARSFGLPFRPFLPEDPPPSERLGEIRVPSMVVWGDRDTETIQRNSAVTAERIPGARPVIMRGAGHMLNLERPGDFNRAARDLMQRAD